MSREDRKKAQDIFRESNFVFTKKGSFEEAYPEIDSITFTVKELGYQGHSQGQISTYTKENMKEYHNCTNLLCYNGGFSMGTIIRQMVVKKETYSKGSQFCQGYEGSPKGRRKYKDCMNCWAYEVTIKYRL